MEREGVQKVWWEKGDEKDARKNGNVFFLSRLRIARFWSSRMSEDGPDRPK